MSRTARGLPIPLMVGSAFVGPVLVNACRGKAKPYRRLNLDVIAAAAIWTAVVRKVAVFHGYILHQKSASKKPKFFNALISAQISCLLPTRPRVWGDGISRIAIIGW
jgi:hypothetical protein